MGIPVVDHLTKLTCEDTFVGEWCGLWLEGDGGLLRTRSHGSCDIIWPSVKHIVIVLYACGIHVGSGYGTSGVGEFIAGNLQGFQGEILRIACLVEDGFPHQYRRMVAIATDNLTSVLVNEFCPVFVFVPVLPTGRRHDDEDAQFVERIHKRWVLRIVGRTNDVHAGILQSLGIAPLLTVGHGITHEGKILVAVAAN